MPRAAYNADGPDGTTAQIGPFRPAAGQKPRIARIATLEHVSEAEVLRRLLADALDRFERRRQLPPLPIRKPAIRWADAQE